jgi:hypothetical protein
MKADVHLFGWFPWDGTLAERRSETAVATGQHPANERKLKRQRLRNRDSHAFSEVQQILQSRAKIPMYLAKMSDRLTGALCYNSRWRMHEFTNAMAQENEDLIRVN